MSYPEECFSCKMTNAATFYGLSAYTLYHANRRPVMLVISGLCCCAATWRLIQ